MIEWKTLQCTRGYKGIEFCARVLSFMIRFVFVYHPDAKPTSIRIHSNLMNNITIVNVFQKENLIVTKRWNRSDIAK